MRLITALFMVVVGLLGREALAQDLTPKSLNKSSCLTFSKNQSVNKTPLFKKIYQIDPSVTVYSSSFDLNGDGRPEYFYYVDDVGVVSYCGSISQQIGSCPIEIFQYTKAGNFISIDEGSTFPGRGFKPDKHLKNYLCVRPDETGSGYKLFEHLWWRKSSQDRNPQDRTFWLHWAE